MEYYISPYSLEVFDGYFKVGEKYDSAVSLKDYCHFQRRYYYQTDRYFS